MHHDVAGPLPGYRQALQCVHYYTTSCNTRSSATEDGRDHRPKHVELIGIINKLLLLHLVGCLYNLHQLCTVKQISNLNRGFYVMFQKHRLGQFMYCIIL